jgi:hypothetical protein
MCAYSCRQVNVDVTASAPTYKGLVYATVTVAPLLVVPVTFGYLGCRIYEYYDILSSL